MVGTVKGALSRPQLVAAALELVQAEGLNALTMRGLAERLGVKAASLYWHLRDRGELVELLAQALLAEVRLPRTPTPGSGWKADALAVCAAVQRAVARRRDASRILLEVPAALDRSQVHGRLRTILETPGLPASEAQEAATLLLAQVLIAAARGVEPAPSSGRPVTVAVDSGSRGVTLRAGPPMAELIRVAHDPGAAAPALIRGDTVIVRRRRGAGRGELELNPERRWHFKVQAPTWSTLLDLPGLDVRGIHIDSGAARVECVLPPPSGEVLINVSGGTVGVRLRRPPGVKVVAEVSAGVFQTRLDALAVAATAGELHWESAGGPTADFYRLRINGGAVRVTLEEDVSIPAAAAAAPAGEKASGGVLVGLDLVLAGVAGRAAELSAG